MREYMAGRGTVRKHNGKWQGVVYWREAPDGEDGACGKWRATTKTFPIKAYPDGNRGKKAAEAALKEWRAELERNERSRARAQRAEEDCGGVVSPRSTVAEWVDYYLTKQLPGEKRVERSTMDGYLRLAHHITERIGSIRLCDLRRAQVEQLRDDLAAAYAPTTVHDALRLLSAALDRAVDGDLIDRNPAKGVRSPSAAQREVNYLDAGERTRLLADLRETLDDDSGAGKAEEGRALALGCELALLTGMREGEICGLRWRDVDLDLGQITVRTSIGRDGDATYEKDPKSHKRRFIPVTDEDLIGDLRKRKRYMAERCGSVGIGSTDSLFVIGRVDGTYCNPRYLYRAWRRRADRLGLLGTAGTRPTFHDLRHTFATVMAHSGVPESSLKSIMGHSSIETTHRYYIGVDTDADRRAMAATMEVMRGGNVLQLRPTGTEG